MAHEEQLSAAAAAAAANPRELPRDVREFVLTHVPTLHEEQHRMRLARKPTEPSATQTLRDDRFRQRVFGSAAPQLATHLERLWLAAGRFPSDNARGRAFVDATTDPPFHERDPARSSGATEADWNLCLSLLAAGRTYQLSLAQMLPLAGDEALLATTVGTATALAIDDGDAEMRAALDALLRGHGPGPAWSAAVPEALLRQSSPDSWDRAHRFLIGAERQEELRRSIVRAAIDSTAEAFIATLEVIAEHNLTRFPGVADPLARALQPLDTSPGRTSLAGLTAHALHLLTDVAARRGALASQDWLAVRQGLWAEAVWDIGASVDAAQGLLAQDQPEVAAAAVAHLLLCDRAGYLRATLINALEHPEIQVATAAVLRLTHHLLGSPPSVAPHVIDSLFARFPAKATIPALGPLPSAPCGPSQVATLALGTADASHLPALVQHFRALDPHTRRQVVITHGRALKRQHRDLLEAALRDRSPAVREAAATELGASLVTQSEDPVGARPAREVEQATPANWFGLITAGDLTPPRTPASRPVTFVDADTRALLAHLDSWVSEHGDERTEWLRPCTGQSQEQQPSVGPALQRLGELDMRNWSWGPSFGASVAAAIDAGLAGDTTERATTLARAALVTRLAGAYPGHDFDQTAAAERQRQDARRASAYIAAEGDLPALNHTRTLSILFGRAAAEQANPASIEWLIDATEHLLLLPAEPPRRLLRRRERIATDRRPWLATVDWLVRIAPDRWTHDAAQRLWGLWRWVMDVHDPLTVGDCRDLAAVWEAGGATGRRPRIPRRPPLALLLRLHELGAASDADLIDGLVGPSGLLHSELNDSDPLSMVTAQHLDYLRERLNAQPAAQEVGARVRDRVVALELQRGEQPVPATEVVETLRVTGGASALQRAVVALGSEQLQRGASRSTDSRRASLSQLILRTLPGPNDSPEAVAPQLRSAGVPPERWWEIASYAPQWAAHIEIALARPGLERGVLWLHAHSDTSDRSLWIDDWEQWQAMLESLTPLSASDRREGAVDVRWFQQAAAQLGEDGVQRLLGAAPYVAARSGHTHAVLAARALLGSVSVAELRERIETKRDKPSVRALGLVPLSADNPGADLRERYELLQEFLRTRTRSGAQRRSSEGRAGEIGLENLARTAGFSDPLRLTWAVEAARASAMLDVASVTDGDLTVSLTIDAAGAPQLRAHRGGAALRGIPAAARTLPAVRELADHQRALRNAQRDVRAALEAAMVRGDAFRAEELATLAGHPLVWPQLRRLVLVSEHGQGVTLGLPSEDGRALSMVDGSQVPLTPGQELRIAHPVDLVRTNTWIDWQRHILSAELTQPFKQLFRELYVATSEEAGEFGGTSRRYRGLEVRRDQALALLTSRGWAPGEEGERVRRMHELDLCSSVELRHNDPLAACSIDTVYFWRNSDGEPLTPAAVPPRGFSEVMRDLDLVVSVAHIEGIDPAWSRSTLDARSALVERTAELLGLDGVTIAERTVRVQGTLSAYTVHLGSGTVAREPGGAVCIVPVTARDRGRVFLPFADEDPLTAEILAKVLLLVRDDEIKDESILAQLRR